MEAVIIDCLRTAVGKAPRGTLRNSRPDDLAAAVIRRLMEKHPEVATDDVDDVIRSAAQRMRSRDTVTGLGLGGRR